MANVQNATQFSMGRKCLFCRGRIANVNKSGVCTVCQKTHKTKFDRHIGFKRAVSAGQETFVFPTKVDF